MNRLCERTSMRRNRRFVRTGMSAAQIRECPEAGECDEHDERDDRDEHDERDECDVIG
jgi:hypothetical protein